MDTELVRLDGAVRLTNLARGTQLYAPGDPSDRVFVVTSGHVKIWAQAPRGKDCVFQVVGPGQIFGEGALFGEPERMNAAEVVEKASVTAVPREAVLQHANRRPEFWQSFASVLGQRIRNLEEQVEWVSFLEVEQRIARLVLRWVDAEKARQPSVEAPQIRLSQKTVAGLIGATRETTSSALNRLRRAGCIEIRRRRLIVRSIDALAQRAGEQPPRIEPQRETVAPGVSPQLGEARRRRRAARA